MRWDENGPGLFLMWGAAACFFLALAWILTH
jgi:hypothetical protein